MTWIRRVPKAPRPHTCPFPQGSIGAGSVWKCDDCGAIWTKQRQGWLSEVQGEAPPDLPFPVAAS